MKKILLSLTMVLFAGGALALGTTGAFFSDKETSTGNTFSAGAIDLKIDNHSYYNGVLNPDTTWELSDLTIQKFFNFLDLKPGDFGEDTISLHVNNNVSYLCANVTLTSNEENGINNPEAKDGDVTDGPGQGELAQNVNFIWWADDGDNVLEQGERVISSGPLGALTLGVPFNVTLADSVSNIWTGAGGPAPGDQTLYLGKAWCFGTITPAPLSQSSNGSRATTTPAQDGDGNGIAGQPADGGYLCNGAALNNTTQTDSLTADVSFDAVQSRNNTSFTCAPNQDCHINTDVTLVPGSGFESPVVVDPAKWDAFTTPVGPWNVEWRDAGPTTFGTQTRPALAKLELHRGVLGAAAEGQQYAELDSDWGGPNDPGTGEPASVRIYQDIPTVAGKQYEIHFKFAARPDTPASDNNVEVGWGGTVASTTGQLAGPSGPINWIEKVVTVTATTTTTRLSFTDLGTANSVGSFIDDIRLYGQTCTPIQPIVLTDTHQ